MPPVLTCSAVEGTGIETVWRRVLRHRAFLGDRGLADNRAGQQLEFTWALVRAELDARLAADEEVKQVRAEIRERVIAGDLSAVAVADLILEAYDRGRTIGAVLCIPRSGTAQSRSRFRPPPARQPAPPARRRPWPAMTS